MEITKETIRDIQLSAAKLTDFCTNEEWKRAFRQLAEAAHHVGAMIAQHPTPPVPEVAEPIELDRKTLGEIHRLAKGLVDEHFSKPGVDEYANLADAAYDLCAWLDKHPAPSVAERIIRSLEEFADALERGDAVYSIHVPHSQVEAYNKAQEQGGKMTAGEVVGIVGQVDGAWVGTTQETPSFLFNWFEMAKAERRKREYCRNLVETSDLPKTRSELQKACEQVYRAGFCAGTKQHEEFLDRRNPGTATGSENVVGSRVGPEESPIPGDGQSA